MTNAPLEPGIQQPSRVVYTCWPFGGLLCGIITIGIGVLLLVDHYFATADEVLWGVGLILLGAVIVAWGIRQRDAW